MQDLDELLKKVWPEVKKRHLFPELPTPKCVQGKQRLGLDIKDKEISISEQFVEDMSQSLGTHEILEGLLDHAVSHYLYCPWDFSTHLKLYGEAKRVLKDREMAQQAADWFMDVVADTYCISQKDTPLPKLYKHLNRGKAEEAIHALYQKIWGIDLGVEGYDQVSRKLSRLPYLDRRQWKESIRKFSKIIQSYLKETDQQFQDSGNIRSLDSHGLQQYSSDEIQRGLEELALEAGSPSEFKELIQDFEEEISDAISLPAQGIGRGAGQGLDGDIFYYMKLAENYNLSVQRTPTEKSGSLYPHQHIPWEVGKPYQDIDPWTSFGKILPGITQIWERTEGEVFSEQQGTPNCIIIIDSSGSMPDPSKHLSHAVLGAACACDAYLRNGASVAVYNFSDAAVGGARTLPYSRQRKEVYRAICHYFGGGTELLVEHIDALQDEPVPDIFLITDMQINNLQNVIGYFNGCKNRVTAVHIGNNKRTEVFRRYMELQGNVGVYPVAKKEDIPHIVLGKIRQYIYR